MKENRRLIHLNTTAIQAMSDAFCDYLGASATRYIKKHVRRALNPLGYFDKLPRWQKTFTSYKDEHTGKAFKVTIKAYAPQFTDQQLRDFLAGGTLSCGGDPVWGGDMQLFEGVGAHEMKHHTIRIKLCPALTISELQAASDAWDGMHFREEVRLVLLHEMTHASDHGSPKDYYDLAKYDGEGAASDARARYYNQPWEVRAFARGISAELVKSAHLLRYNFEKYGVSEETKWTDLDKETPGEVIDDLLWDNDEFNKIYPKLTKENKKILLQLIARELDERGLL